MLHKGILAELGDIEDHLVELRLAGAVQDALLTVDIPHCRCGRVVLRNRMSRTVGGDFYHVRPLGDDQLVFAIGDVAGHGVGAALVMTIILGLLRTDGQYTRRPALLLGEINDLLLSLGRRIDNFITCSLIYGIVDLPTGVVIYVNAGHPHPLLCHRQDAAMSFLSPTTMLLGVQEGAPAESCHQFRQHDRLILFTDGILEASQGHGDLFGADRLEQIVRAGAHQSPDQLADAIFAATTRFTGTDELHDDQTLAIIDFDNTTSSI